MNQPVSYGTRGRAAPHNHSVYEVYCQSLRLNDSDFLDLKNRGLHPETIKTAGYASKMANNNGVVAEALNKLRSQFEVEGVPGFFVNDKGHWTQSGITGIAIPVRDVEGHISSILIRNSRPTERNGKVTNKYVAFSSAGKEKGAKVWQTTHCPIVKGMPKDVAGTTVRITEGVLKADVSTALGEFYCLGMQGLKLQSDFELLIEELEVSELRICIDSGEDENIDIVRCRAEIITRATAAGIDVKVEIWDEKFGKGLDDVLHSGHADKIKIATDEEIDKMLEDANAKNPNNGEYIYVVSLKKFVSKNDFIMMDKTQFADMFGLEKTEHVNQMIANGFEQCWGLTFYPTKPKMVEEEGRMCLNLWQDPCVVPKEGDVSVFTDHMEYLLPDELQRDIFYNFLAFNVQNPGEKILWTLLMQGCQGIGKSYLAEVMGMVLGRKNISTPSNEALHEPYTDWLKRAQLVVVEEVMARGRLDLMNKLKPIITQPRVMVREMYSPPYEQPNRMNMLMFTNHADPIVIDDDDRRYAIIKSESSLQSEEYYKKLWDWTKKPETPAAIAHFFMTRDLSNFNPYAKAPETEAKKELIKISRGKLDEWIQECMNDEEWPFHGDIVSVRHLKSERVCPRGCQGFSDHKWAESLKRAGAVQYPQQIKLSSGSRTRVWIIKRQEMFLALEPSEISKQYEKWLQSEQVGGNPLEDSAPI